MGTGQATQERATLAYVLFGAGDNQGPTDSRRAFHLPLNCLKNSGQGLVLEKELLPERTFHTKRTRLIGTV